MAATPEQVSKALELVRSERAEFDRELALLPAELLQCRRYCYHRLAQLIEMESALVRELHVTAN